MKERQRLRSLKDDLEMLQRSKRLAHIQARIKNLLDKLELERRRGDQARLQDIRYWESEIKKLRLEALGKPRQDPSKTL